MNILIITPFYKHDRNIASVRWTNIGIRLAKKHNVIVVTQPHDDMDMNTTIEKDEDGVLVARINQKTWYEKTAVKHFGGATGDDWQTAAGNGELTQASDNLKRKLKNRLLYSSMKSKAKSYARYILSNVIPVNTKIDIVISSACPFIEMLFGYELKKCLGCKWISDFRDLPFQEDTCDDTHIQKKIMQEVLPNADAITIVVSCMIEKLCETALVDMDKIHIVTNGFSLAEKRKAEPNKDNKLHIVHTGSLYGGRRNADLFFEALGRLKEQGITGFVFECAGGNNFSLLKSAQKFHCEDSIIDHGFVSREEAMRLQGYADCLLVIAEPYMLPAKLFEYVLNERPIIAVLIGENEYQHETQPFIEDLHLGVAFAENDWEQSVDRLVYYLSEQIDRKKQKQRIDYQPDMEKVKQYDHDYLTEKIEEIISSIV